MKFFSQKARCVFINHSFQISTFTKLIHRSNIPITQVFAQSSNNIYKKIVFDVKFSEAENSEEIRLKNEIKSFENLSSIYFCPALRVLKTLDFCFPQCISNCPVYTIQQG